VAIGCSSPAAGPVALSCAARSVADGGRRPTIRVSLRRRMFLAGWSPACAVVCHAVRGRWRPQADDTGLTLSLTLILGLGFALLD
jgi:hypothetical protein